ncbi:5-dehydro-2-deoxygluconokinase [Anaerotruncus sp. AF02-27]|uniref:5-dehydro-2-deoxygluconokinase n=1 Tax=Anaerotruncus TaxID=244127 RepID=UPI000E4695BD|nr:MULTISPECIES: 5-dehydro-2-deoxygluconokinase [Anaerotruncus]RGX56474.1 5-dehydro-2-deoxygluconokinase [Anaerotruncus sp. AF02-27]
MIQFDSTKPRDVVAFGRATVDLYANGFGPIEEIATFSKFVGGSPANTAVAMANLGLRTGYIGKVSDDGLGRFVIRYLEGKGIDISHIAFAAPGVRSGLTIGEFIAPRKSNYYVYRNDCADLQIDCAQLDEKYIASHKMILISGTSLSHSPVREAVFLAMEFARRNGTKIALDLDYREGTWDSVQEASIYYMMACEKADMVLGTREEFDVMEYCYMPDSHDNRASANRLLKAGVSIVSIKKGKKGSDVYTSDGQVYEGSTYPAKIENTFGAGDSYSGAFNYCMIHGISVPEALKYAAASSSITISGQSCSEAMPNLVQVEEYMRTHEYGAQD